jgi:hypothetical protein
MTAFYVRDVTLPARTMYLLMAKADEYGRRKRQVTFRWVKMRLAVADCN